MDSSAKQSRFDKFPPDLSKKAQEYIKFTKSLQTDIISWLKQMDPNLEHIVDDYERPNGHGEGSTQALSGGKIFAKAGVNWSLYFGKSLPPSILAKHPKLVNQSFTAIGTSVIIHPLSPFHPSIHCNYRFFQVNEDIWWVGGGTDISPSKLVDAAFPKHLPPSLENVKSYIPLSIKRFHQHYKNVMKMKMPPLAGEENSSKTVSDNFLYKLYKLWCDDYFYIPHRQEARGCGGVFFDYLNTKTTQLYTGHQPKCDAAVLSQAHTFAKPVFPTWESLFGFAQAVGNAFLPSYSEFFKIKPPPATSEDYEFQYVRRGRYAEFNLCYDRGTKFGLQASGRIQSILLSMPPKASWDFFIHQPCGEDAWMTLLFQPGIEFISYD